MKILHTSDWHLGHTLYNYDRMEEQRDMILQIKEIVQDQKPDVFLLCGDVYHTAQPSAAIQTLFTEAIVEIHHANPQMSIIITAGNHDSAAKHEIFRTPWRALKVYTIGNLDKENINEHIIEIPGKGFILAVPYCNERNIPDGFFQTLIDAAEQRNTKQLPIVMTAHTTVRGCDFTGHDQASEFVVGGIDSLEIEQLGKGFDYLALGHIHHAQFIHTGRHNVRYSGTPLATSFDETYAHSISIVEIECHHETPRVKTLEIKNLRPLVTLPVRGTATWEEAKQLLLDFPDNIPAYIRLNVEVNDFLPIEANAEAHALTQNKKCRFCHIQVQKKAARQFEERILTVQEFQAENPLNIAQQYAEDCGITFDEEMKSLFNDVIKMIENDERNY